MKTEMEDSSSAISSPWRLVPVLSKKERSWVYESLPTYAKFLAGLGEIYTAHQVLGQPSFRRREAEDYL
jgi:hypothetical protein